VHVFCHFLLAQKVTKKGTTKTNRLLVFVAPPAPGPAELAVRTFRGQASRRKIELMLQDKIRANQLDQRYPRSSFGWVVYID
jgi:hypothetical protein